MVDGPAPAASVIVALNPHACDLSDVLDAYLAQTMPSATFEVIVVDGGARADAREAIADHARRHRETPVRTLAIERPGRAAANNAGARDARAGLLIFVADDLVPCPTLVRAHVEFHRQLQRAAVGIGPALFRPALRRDPFRCWLEDSGELFGVPFRSAERAWPPDFFYVGNASIARPLFERIGPFVEDFRHDLMDDREFGLRLHRAVVRTHYLPKALAWHEHAVDLAERTEAMRRCGAALRLDPRGALPGRWSVALARPLDELAAVIRTAEEAERREATPLTRGARFRAQMEFAVAEGYRAAAGQVEEAADAGKREIPPA